MVSLVDLPAQPRAYMYLTFIQEPDAGGTERCGFGGDEGWCGARGLGGGCWIGNLDGLDS